MLLLELLEEVASDEVVLEAAAVEVEELLPAPELDTAFSGCA